MNCIELCERFNLSITAVEEIKAAGLLRDSDTPVCEQSFSEDDISFLSRILTYKNAGIEFETIKELIRMEEIDECCSSEMINLLTEQRKKKISQLHFEQKMLDRLDYLIVEMKGRRP